MIHRNMYIFHFSGLRLFCFKFYRRGWMCVSPPRRDACRTLLSTALCLQYLPCFLVVQDMLRNNLYAFDRWIDRFNLIHRLILLDGWSTVYPIGVTRVQSRVCGRKRTRTSSLKNTTVVLLLWSKSRKKSTSPTR